MLFLDSVKSLILKLNTGEQISKTPSNKCCHTKNTAVSPWVFILSFQPPLNSFVWELPHRVHSVLISHRVCRTGLYLHRGLSSISTHAFVWDLGGAKVPQEGIKTKTKSHTKMKVFKHGLMLGHEFTPFNGRPS